MRHSIRCDCGINSCLSCVCVCVCVCVCCREYTCKYSVDVQHRADHHHNKRDYRYHQHRLLRTPDVFFFHFFLLKVSSNCRETYATLATALCHVGSALNLQFDLSFAYFYYLFSLCRFLHFLFNYFVYFVCHIFNYLVKTYFSLIFEILMLSLIHI